MEYYILPATIWIIGAFYSWGVHQNNKDIVIKESDEDIINKLSVPYFLDYIVLFFYWPHYLGYGK